MKAKEIFEKLGWKYHGFNPKLEKIDVRYTTKFKNEKKEEIEIIIDFHCDRYIKITSFNDKKGFDYSIFYFTPELIKAINQQVKELGWLDE